MPVTRSPLISGTIEAVGRILSRRILEVADKEGLSADQWYTLDVIARNDGVTMTDIARSLGMPAPTITKHVDRLVTGALAFRLADHFDRRKVLVHASKRGILVHTFLLAQVQEIEDEFFSRFSFKEKRLLIQSLQSISIE
ncbi:MarR family transcriptional regulator [Rhodococcus qingshengii]|nr:MarR family transcriptional regulator [Rhodococcus qingshengii]